MIEPENQYDSEQDGAVRCPLGFVMRKRELVDLSERCTYPNDCEDCPIRQRNLI